MVSIRSDRPVNLVNAFENPVKSRSGYLLESADRLKDEFEKTKRFTEKPIETYSVGEIDGLGKHEESLNELLEVVGETIEKLL